MIRISVVTPSLNQGRFIERTIHSVLDQQYSALEYVVRDGGSTDSTAAILASFADRLTAVFEADHGQADAINKGIRATSGEVIGWLNSDDVYQPGTLALVDSFMAARPEVDVLYGGAQLIDAEGHVLGAYYTEPWSPTRLPSRNFLCQPAVFLRRTVIERFGLLDDRLQYCMDYEFWLRLAAGGATFAYVSKVLAGSRLHPAAKTLSSRLAVHAEINGMLYDRLGHVPDSWLLNHAHTLVELRRAERPWSAMPYALEVVARSVRLSLQWNRSVSRELVVLALGPILDGAKRRAFQSRSAATRRPAN